MTEYSLISHELEVGISVLCLRSSSANKDFIDDWLNHDRPEGSLSRFTTVIQRLQKHGLHQMLCTTKLDCIDGELDLYEVKNYCTTDRVIAVIQNTTIVLVTRYTAHKGGNTNNNPKMMKDAKRKAALIKEMLSEEGESGEN